MNSLSDSLNRDYNLAGGDKGNSILIYGTLIFPDLYTIDRSWLNQNVLN